MTDPRHVAIVLGTRPEVIKLAPVQRALTAAGHRTTVIVSGQHRDLVPSFARELDLPIDHDLGVGRDGQTPLEVLERTIAAVGPMLATLHPDIVIVQGDTTTTLAGALAAFHLGIPIGHVEAGLRSGDRKSPFPEEMNRQMVTRLTDVHFAATEHNQIALMREGIASESIRVTGNPVVDQVQHVLARTQSGPDARSALEFVGDRRMIFLTTHRRESFGAAMAERLAVLASAIERHDDTALVFPVHPNPAVRSAAGAAFGGSRHVRLVEPLGYADCIHLLRAAHVIVSDSGGIQEEAPSVGRPLIVIRDNTERPEVLEAGAAVLARNAEALERYLGEALTRNGAPVSGWMHATRHAANPFGDGHAATRIVAFTEQILANARPAP